MNSDYRQQIENLANKGSLREFRPLEKKENCRVQYMNSSMLNMTSNDYLGVAGDKEILRLFYHELAEDSLFEKYGLGAASSRLLTGDSYTSHLLEDVLKKEYDRPACLLFNSGYHANIGILPTLVGKKDLILSDKLNHASIHDGMRLSRAAHKRFRHCDYEHLVDLLEKNRNSFDKVVIVSESVFSMDGDEADLKLLVSIKKKYDCMLYIDEAHGVGVYGDKGLGKAEEAGVVSDVDLLVGTFGKAFASVGAFVVCEQDIYDYLVNFSRSLIFTTALPPVVVYWNYFIFKKIRGMTERRENLLQLGNKLRSKLADFDLQTAGTTNIVPVIIGENQKTVDIAQKMQGEGYLIFAVRPPTVPEGTARFRLSLTATMEWRDIERLPSRIAKSLA